MTFKKTFWAGLTGIALFSGIAFAHPHSEDDQNKDPEKDVKIYKLDKDWIKGKVSIEDFDMDGFDLETFLEDFEGLESLEHLKELEVLKDMDLAQLADLGNFDVQTFDNEDGSKKIIIKRGEDGVFGKHEFRWDSDKMHEKHAEFMDKHKKMIKKLHKRDGENSREVIKRMLDKNSDKDVTIWADNDQERILELDGDTRIVLDGDGEVTVLNDNGDSTINIDKDVTVENGKRKTRIVIEMETDDE